jgi:hypothetical protein
MIRRISGCTRVVGKSQGYLGLPVRDITINDAVSGPGTPAMQTAWEPTPGELKLIVNGSSIILTVLGTSHPPVMLTVDGLSTEEAVTARRVIEAMRNFVQAMTKQLPEEHAKLANDLVMVANRYLSA